MSSSEVVGILRGAAPPPEALLEALQEISANFRVSYTPPVVRDGKVRRPPLWWVHEVRPFAESDGLYRDAGRARLRRLSRRPVKEQEERIADWWDAEHAATGYYRVGSYYPERVRIVDGVRIHPSEMFGTRPMLDQLRRAQQMLEAEQRKAQVETQRERGAVGEIQQEMQENPEFAGFVRDVAKDFYRAVSGGQLVLMDGLKEASSDDANGESMGGPGHGGDREPWQHSDGPAGQPAEGEIRPGRDGGDAAGP